MITEISMVGINILISSFLPYVNKNLMQYSKMDAATFTTMQWLISIPIAIIASLFFKDTFSQTSNFYIIIFLTLLAVFCSSIIYFYLLKRFNANLLTVIISPLVLILTSIIGSLVFKEPFTNQMWIGLIILLIGLIIFILGKK